MTTTSFQSKLIDNLIKPIEDGFAHLAGIVRKNQEKVTESIGDLTTLKGEKKESLVAAINEVAGNRVLIDDDAVGDHLWTATKINAILNTTVNTAVTNLLGGADENNDTLKEIADRVTQAMQLDKGILTTTTSQAFSESAKAIGRANLGLGKLATKDTEINDSEVTETNTWSAKKISDSINDLLTINKDFRVTINHALQQTTPAAASPAA